MKRRSKKAVRTSPSSTWKRSLGRFKRNAVNFFAVLGFASVLLLAGWFFFGGG